MPRKSKQLNSQANSGDSTEMSSNVIELENLHPEHEDRIKLRRKEVLKLWIQGFSQAEMAEKLDYNARTIARDLVEVKKERGKAVEEIIKKFNINEFIGQKLKGIERRRQIMSEELEKSIPPSARVRVSQELRELEVEEENLFIRLNIKTMEGKPEDLLNQNRIAVFTGAPPAGYKMPDNYVADNPPNEPSKKP